MMTVYHRLYLIVTSADLILPFLCRKYSVPCIVYMCSIAIQSTVQFLTSICHHYSNFCRFQWQYEFSTGENRLALVLVLRTVKVMVNNKV